MMEVATFNPCMELGQNESRVTSSGVPVCSQILRQGLGPFSQLRKSSLAPCNQQCEVPVPENDKLVSWYVLVSTNFSSLTAGILLPFQLHRTSLLAPEYDFELRPMSTFRLEATNVDGDAGDMGTKVINS